MIRSLSGPMDPGPLQDCIDFDVEVVFKLSPGDWYELCQDLKWLYFDRSYALIDRLEEEPMTFPLSRRFLTDLVRVDTAWYTLSPRLIYTLVWNLLNLHLKVGLPIFDIPLRPLHSHTHRSPT